MAASAMPCRNAVRNTRTYSSSCNTRLGPGTQRGDPRPHHDGAPGIASLPFGARVARAVENACAADRKVHRLAIGCICTRLPPPDPVPRTLASHRPLPTGPRPRRPTPPAPAGDCGARRARSRSSTTTRSSPTGLSVTQYLAAVQSRAQGDHAHVRLRRGPTSSTGRRSDAMLDPLVERGYVEIVRGRDARTREASITREGRDRAGGGAQRLETRAGPGRPQARAGATRGADRHAGRTRIAAPGRPAPPPNARNCLDHRRPRRLAHPHRRARLRRADPHALAWACGTASACSCSR